VNLNADVVNASPPGILCDALAGAWSNRSEQLQVLAAAALPERMKVGSWAEKYVTFNLRIR
jgi:hypothetical protein